MYGHILVAVDGSNSSNLALEHAIRLAIDQRSELRIVHVVDTTMLFDSNSDFIDIGELEKNLVEAAQGRLNKAESIVGAAGIKVETRLRKAEHYNQRIADLIVEESDAWPADLLVLGTHGRRGFSHLFLGSVAEGVMRISKAPVLLIRSQ